MKVTNRCKSWLSRHPNPLTDPLKKKAPRKGRLFCYAVCGRGKKIALSPQRSLRLAGSPSIYKPFFDLTSN